MEANFFTALEIPQVRIPARETIQQVGLVSLQGLTGVGDDHIFFQLGSPFDLEPK